MIGKIFNQRYQIKEKLGSGGTAIVYQGQDTLLNRMVTIKILREEYASNEDFVRRFRREAQAVASLSHGNIVSVYDVGFEENMHYIVMEFVEGYSLKDYIKQKGIIPVQEASSIMTKILYGIAYAHEHGIVHRDIKAHNILLGTDGRAKVTDFGIAVGMTDMTQTYNTSSRIMGSVHYIAPEQVQGQPVTEKSDIYSAGVLFYEMLTGQLPFSGDTPISIAMQHVQGELILPHQLNPKIPVGLSYVVMRAMRKNPETRYESAKEMAEAIRSVTEGLNSVYVPPPEENLEGTRELDALLPGRDTEFPHEHNKRSQGLFKRAPQERVAPRDYRRDKNAPRRRVSAMSIMFMVLMIAFLGTVVWAVGKIGGWINPDQQLDDKVTVPNVVGKDWVDAAAELTALELVVSPEIIRRNDENFPIDQVMQQSVAAFTEVNKGREITLTVSDGPRRTEVPLVIGESRIIAENRLRKEGLVASYQEEEYEEYSDDFPAGDIINQDPVAGEMVQGGTLVWLIVSLGPEPVPVKVPNVLEKSFEEAKALLEEAGLSVGTVKREESNIYYEEIVMAQSVPGDSELNEGESVNLTVSRGPGPSYRTYIFSYNVPNDGMSHQISLVIDDSQGRREVYNQVLGPNYSLQEMVSFFGQGTISVYCDGDLMEQRPLPTQ